MASPLLVFASLLLLVRHLLLEANALVPSVLVWTGSAALASTGRSGAKGLWSFDESGGGEDGRTSRLCVFTWVGGSCEVPQGAAGAHQEPKEGATSDLPRFFERSAPAASASDGFDARRCNGQKEQTTQ